VTDTFTTTRKHGVHKFIFPRMLFFSLMCMRKHIFGRNIFCALHVFLRPLCARTCAQLRGNIAKDHPGKHGKVHPSKQGFPPL